MIGLTKLKEIQFQPFGSTAVPVNQAYSLPWPATIRMDTVVVFLIFQRTVSLQSNIYKKTHTCKIMISCKMF